jgi:hypothetical protein
MVRTIRVIYTDSLDPDWMTEEVEEILLAPDMVIDNNEGEPFIFVLDYPVKEDQTFIYIDRETCKRFYAEFLSSEMNHDWLTKATFMQVVRGFSKRPREN